MNVIRHVNQLLALDDKALVEALYLTLLKREPDPDGLDFYVGQLRAGHDKGGMIAEFASSPEAGAAGRDLPGLEQFLDAQRARARSFWGRLRRTPRHEQQLNRIENALGRTRQEIDAAVGELRRRLDAIENRLAMPMDAAADAGQGATDADRRPGDVDLMGVPLLARRIFRELSAAAAAIARQEKI